jgi:hypothetical protein
VSPLQPPYPCWYKSGLTYEYHADIAGYNIHTCNAFKKKLLQLIKTRWIMFEETPNVNTNPLPNHASGNRPVNVLEVEHLWSLKVPMNRIYEMMIKSGYKKGSMNFYKYHGEESHMINQCEGLCDKVIQMMIQGIL